MDTANDRSILFLCYSYPVQLLVDFMPILGRLWVSEKHTREKLRKENWTELSDRQLNPFRDRGNLDLTFTTADVACGGTHVKLTADEVHVQLPHPQIVSSHSAVHTSVNDQPF